MASGSARTASAALAVLVATAIGLTTTPAPARADHVTLGTPLVSAPPSFVRVNSAGEFGFGWAPLAGATGYEVLWSSGSTFGSVVVGENCGEPAQSSGVRLALAPNREYSLSVRGRITNDGFAGCGIHSIGPTSPTVRTVVDAVAPTLAITIEGGAAYTTSPLVTVQLAASDPPLIGLTPASGVATVRIGPESIPACSPTGSCAGAVPFAGALPVVLSGPDGLRSVAAVAYDAAVQTLAQGSFLDPLGNASATATDSIVLDRRSPDPATPVAPAGGAATFDRRPTFEWAPAVDATSGVDRYEIVMDGAVIGTAPGSATTFTPAADLPVGAHAWQIRAYDRAGNPPGTSVARPLTIDIPVVAAATGVRVIGGYRAGRLRASLEIRGTASGPGAAVVRLRRAAGPRVTGLATSVASRLRVTAAGPFRSRVPLPPLMAPGSWSVRLEPASAGASPASFTLERPPAGVVRRSYISGVAGGPPGLVFADGTRRLFCNVLFGIPPRPGGARALVMRWRAPLRASRGVGKAPAARVVGVIGLDRGLPPGRYTCTLTVGGTPVTRAAATVRPARQAIP